MSKVFASITRHNSPVTHHIPVTEYDQLYDHMMWLTGNDHEISDEAASWCEMAAIGEEYNFREGYIILTEMES